MKPGESVLMSRFIKDLNRGCRELSGFCLALSFLFFLIPQRGFSERGDIPKPVNTIFIEVDGNGHAEEEGIKSLISLKAGDFFSLTKINQSIKQIYRTGLFSDVYVVKQEGEHLDLTFRLIRKLFIRRIHFRGDRDIKWNKLKKQMIVLREGTSFTEERVSRAAEELKSLLSEQGDFDAQINTSSEKDTEKKFVDVYFDIQSTKRYVIDEISFVGDVILSKENLIKGMRSKIGANYIPEVLKKDIERLEELYFKEGYQRVEIGLKNQRFEEKRASLELEIEPKERIRILIRGADIPVDLVNPIWEARIFEEWGLSEGEAKIKSFMRKKGYLFVSVASSIERNDNLVRIIYDVKPGKKFKIKDMTFQGVKYFSPEELKERLSIEKAIPLLSKRDGARLFELPREMELLYETQGFSETQVELIFEPSGESVRPIFHVKEGPQRRIVSLVFEGASFFDSDPLLKQINSFPEGPFYDPRVQNDIELIERFYMDQGFRGTSVKALIDIIEDSEYSVRFQIEEGKRVIVENIIITGNEITRQSTIRREFLIKEGDYAFLGKIRETKRRLEKLGIFTTVRVEEIPLPSQKENLLISVREGDRSYISLGVGMETRNEPRSFDIWNNTLRPRGTAEFIRSNIFGRASQFSIVGQASLKERRGVFSWEQPYFFGMKMETFLNAWLEQEERKSYSFYRRGVSLSGIRPLSIEEDLVLLATLRFARTSLIDLEIAESAVDRQHFPFSTTSISGSLIWDKRNEPFNPERGYFFSTVLEWAYPLFNAESNYLKIFSKFQKYILLFSGIDFSTTFRLGLGRGRIPIHERFFAGGSNSFRGAEFDELGPRDPVSLKPVGGKALILLNFELTFPLVPQIKYLHGAIFYDKGNVFFRRSQISLKSLRDAFGLGVRYATPLGPVRVEVGWDVDAPEGERKTLLFVTIGNVF